MPRSSIPQKLLFPGAPDAAEPESDANVDLAAYGVDWDAAADRRIHRRRRMIAPRRTPA